MLDAGPGSGCIGIVYRVPVGNFCWSFSDLGPIAIGRSSLELLYWNLLDPGDLSGCSVCPVCID